jgi:hypothetical protein
LASCSALSFSCAGADVTAAAPASAMGVPSILVSASGNPRSTWEDGRAELVIHPVIGS